jgi:hypothetical protein
MSDQERAEAMEISEDNPLPVTTYCAVCAMFIVEAGEIDEDDPYYDYDDDDDDELGDDDGDDD